MKKFNKFIFFKIGVEEGRTSLKRGYSNFKKWYKCGGIKYNEFGGL